MNKNEKVLEIVNGVIIDRLTQLIEEMSNNEFVEMIGDMYFDQTGKNIEDDTDDDEDFDKDEYLNKIIGSRVLPLLHKICEYGIGKDIPTK
jgi:uncharacterized protein (DUF2267 family)